MKILFVPSDNNATSGAFLSMVKLCSLLQKQYSHDILVLLHCNGNGEELLRNNNIRYVKIRSFNWFVPYKPKQIIRKIKLALCYIWMPLSQLYNAIAIRKIRKLIKKEKVQIVHINTSCSYVGGQAALMEKIPFVWHIREFLEEDQERCIWNNKKGYSLIGEASKVVAISNSIYQKYKTLLPETDIVTIYNGIDSDDFYIDRENLFSEDKIKLAIVGSINRSKGQDQAIKACEILITEGIENISLQIAGKESEYVNSLRNYVGSRNLGKWIQFIGPQSDVKKLYQNTDIVLMCSQSEAFGRVTVEAMMSGCLVIGANAGGTMELISDNVTGLLYTSGDYSDLAEKIKFALKYPEKMRVIAKHGQNKMLNEMTAQNNASRINEIYREIVSNTEVVK
ncbi:MAG: glycosyltransferase family 4 protein [Oscillospiraceae bacterium]|nr:glycosyltransferase family 4 protein [Oscillospiraceae bacterium]